MTEIEIAHQNFIKIKEIDAEILKCKEFQLVAKKSHDNILDKTWANRIKELKIEKAQIDSVGRYVRFTIFTQVVKTYLTKSQYIECWDKVDQILETPNLLQ